MFCHVLPRITLTVQSRNQSSIGQELRWLGLWLVIFVIVTVLLVRFVMPHNDRVAVMLSAIVSGVVMIALRARASGRLQKP